MAFRLHEFADGRGIAAVVPVTTPNDTAEPGLLSMSPEQVRGWSSGGGGRGGGGRRDPPHGTPMWHSMHSCHLTPRHHHSPFTTRRCRPTNSCSPPPFGQAEETAAKLRELETDMLLRRQESRRGVSCCGLVVTRASDTLPEHLRVWEMLLE